MVIAIPTASGKTFLAELCAIQHILSLKGKVIYLSPLKALASEKFNDFKRFRSLGVKIGIALGDYDSADKIDSYDFLVSTNEKIDSLLRHRRSFVKNISLVIVDECHLIDDGTRGPTLEALIVKLRILQPTIQILALSATISNAHELAKWLDATLVKSDWRSVPLKEFYCLKDGLIVSRDQKQDSRLVNLVGNSALSGLVKETLDDKGQVLIFTNSRKRTQSIAMAIKEVSRRYLSSRQHEELLTTISNLKKDINLRDKTSLALFEYISYGLSFHHAGLNSTQRRTIEQLFKKGLIKVIVATPTLAAGINLPARRVMIANIWRFSSRSGRMNPIKVMEYEQMRGRAGRPRYDTF